MITLGILYNTLNRLSAKYTHLYYNYLAQDLDYMTQTIQTSEYQKI